MDTVSYCQISVKVIINKNSKFPCEAFHDEIDIIFYCYRYGQHYFASRLYHKLSTHVSVEKLHFFLSALAQISKAECILIHGHEYEALLLNYAAIDPNFQSVPPITPMIISERLEKAVELYWKALATLKASSSPSHPLTFQSEFVRLRATFLEALFNLVIIKNTQSITPPPAIAQTLAQKDQLQKFGHVTNQLRNAVKSIKACEDMYGKLYKSAFDADPCTLEYLEM